MLSTFKAVLTGTAPLMMHNERLANPKDPHTRALKALTSVKKKTDETLDEIQKVEWVGGLYEKDGVVVLPAANVLAALKNGAQKLKRGKDISSSVFSTEAFYPLNYSGPKDLDKLYADGRFNDYRSVGVNRARVMRSRPVFPQWSAQIDFDFDHDVIDADTIAQALAIAGKQIGVCEHRPQYGRFSLEVL